MSLVKSKMYETIKKILSEGGKCLLIENGKPIGMVLTVEEYELLKSKFQITNHPPDFATTKSLRAGKSQKDEKMEKEKLPVENAIGKAIAEEMNFPSASANIDEINLADAESVTLEDLGLDELPY